MPRVYRRRPGARSYENYTPNKLKKTTDTVKCGRMSIRKPAKHFQFHLAQYLTVTMVCTSLNQVVRRDCLRKLNKDWLRGLIHWRSVKYLLTFLKFVYWLKIT